MVGVVTIRVMNGQNINLALGAPRFAALKAADHLVSFEELARKAGDEQRPDAISDWWYRNGLNSLWLGNYDSALGYFETAVNKNPQRADAWIQVGFCKVKQGKNQDAIRAFEQALKLRPNSYEALNKLGDAYYYAGNYYKALDAYQARRRPAARVGRRPLQPRRRPPRTRRTRRGVGAGQPPQAARRHAPSKAAARDWTVKK